MSASKPISPQSGFDRRWHMALLVFFLLFFFRSLVTFPMEHADAAFKYEAAAKSLRQDSLNPLLNNHHTLRWSEVLPQIAVTNLTQFRYEGLYLLPLVVFALTGTLIWAFMQPHLSTVNQGLLLLLYFLEPLALKHTGQLLNPPFGVLYCVLALTLLARDGPPGWLRVTGAALLFFCAYGAHSTYLSFSAAGFFWLWVYNRQPLKALGLAAILLGLMLTEILAVNALSDWTLSFGRFEKLAGGGHTTWVLTQYDPIKPIDLITRWFKLPWFNLFIVGGFLSCLAWLAVDKQARKRTSPIILLCLMAGFFYMVSITFAILDWQPLRPLMPLRNMYLEPLMPFAIIGSVFLFARATAGFGQRQLAFMNLGVVAMMAISVAWYAHQTQSSWQQLVNYRLSAFTWQSQTEISGLAQRFRRGEVILTGPNRGAIVKVIQYQFPTRLVNIPDAQVTFSRRIKRNAKCVGRIRKTPLVLNERRCTEQEKRAAQTYKPL